MLYQRCATLFRHCFNVGHWRCINVMQRWKSNVGFCLIHDVQATLIRRRNVGWDALHLQKNPIILRLFKTDTLNFTMYISTILTCPLKSCVIELHNLILINIFFTIKITVFFYNCKESAENIWNTKDAL